MHMTTKVFEGENWKYCPIVIAWRESQLLTVSIHRPPTYLSAHSEELLKKYHIIMKMKQIILYL